MYLFINNKQDFDELIEMAQRGRSHKVDMTAGDTKNEEHTDVDLYSEFSNDLLVYGFGKLGEEKYKGTFFFGYTQQ